MLLRPLPHGIEVPAFVTRIEIGIRFRGGLVPPYLPEYGDVHGAHELLAEDVEAVGWELLVTFQKGLGGEGGLAERTDMEAEDLVGVLEGVLAPGVVILVIIVEALAEEVLGWQSQIQVVLCIYGGAYKTMEVMKSLDISREAASVLLAHLDLIRGEASLHCKVGWNDGGSVCHRIQVSCESRCVIRITHNRHRETSTLHRLQRLRPAGICSLSIMSH